MVLCARESNSGSSGSSVPSAFDGSPGNTNTSPYASRTG